MWKSMKEGSTESLSFIRSLNEYTRFCKPGYGNRIKKIRDTYGKLMAMAAEKGVDFNDA